MVKKNIDNLPKARGKRVLRIVE